jgi:hypothetical protein
MKTDRESEIRERMTRHWLASENAIRPYIAGAVNSLTDREDLLQQVALTMAREIPNHRFLPKPGPATTILRR